MEARVYSTLSVANTNPVRLARAWWYATCLIVLSTTLCLLARRIAGGLQTPLQPTALLATGLTAAVVTIALRSAWLHLERNNSSTASRWLREFGFSLPSAIILSLGLAISVAGTTTGSLIGFWFIVVAEEFGSWTLHFRRSRRTGGSRRVVNPTCQENAAGSGTGHATETATLDPEQRHEPDSELAEEPEWGLAEDVSQQITRGSDDGGRESVSGFLRAEFEAGQRSESVHVSFCPPLSAMPTVHVDHVSGPSATLKPADIRIYGLRIDLRLPKPAPDACSIVIHFFAQ